MCLLRRDLPAPDCEEQRDPGGENRSWTYDLIYAVILGVGLFVIWLLWSGHYTPLIIGFGVASCTLVVLSSLRMQIVDEEPSGPQLQVVPGLDLRQMQAAEEERYNSYGWVDQPADIVHIPVDKAIDLLLENGLPTRQEEGASAE